MLAVEATIMKSIFEDLDDITKSDDMDVTIDILSENDDELLEDDEMEVNI